MIDCTILDNGDLSLSCDDCEDLAQSLESYGFWTAFCDAMEPHSCNGSFMPFDARMGNPFVGLSDAPCIAESMSIRDDGTHEIDGRFWFHNDYMISCAMERLAKGETVVFGLGAE